MCVAFFSFQGGGGIRMPAVPPVVAPSDTPSDREQIETELIKSLLWSYFQIVRCVDAITLSGSASA